MSTKWIVVLISAIMIIISIVYGFVQTVKAQAAEREALAQKAISEEQIIAAELARIEADHQRQLYMECQKQLEACGNGLKNGK